MCYMLYSICKVIPVFAICYMQPVLVIPPDSVIRDAVAPVKDCNPVLPGHSLTERTQTQTTSSYLALIIEEKV